MKPEDLHAILGCQQLGDFPRRTDQPVKTYGERRKCACGTTLMRFNPTDRCHVCQQKDPRDD